MLDLETNLRWQRPSRTDRANHEGRVSEFGQVKAYRFKEVLDMAYTHGLRSLRTMSLDVRDVNGIPTAIAEAMAVFVNDDGSEDIFTAWGDANSTNVNNMVKNHFIRMAETRAQARVLARALNLDAVTAEELGGEDTDAPSKSNVTPFQPRVQPANTKQYPDLPQNSEKESGYECEECGEEIKGYGKYTAAQNAFFSKRATGKILCPVHRKEAEGK